MKKKRGKKSIILAVIEDLIIIVGLSFLLYPYASDWWNQYNRSKEITSYTSLVDEESLEQSEEMYQAAIAYNDATRNISAGADLTDEQKALYEQTLTVGGTEVMGYIQIDKIDCTLPIYHGTDESILQVAVGHLPWSSLPAASESSHAVLSGHTGLPSAKLFTRLDEMEIGDTFCVYVMNHKLTYKVDQIEVVLPTDVSYLQKEEGKTLCTLITCTPYGINTHRLLVRGELVSDRVVSTKNMAEEAAIVEDRLVMYFAAAVGVGIVVVGGLIFGNRRRRKRKEAREAMQQK